MIGARSLIKFKGFSHALFFIRALILFTIPVAILTNALRIAAVSLMTVYVDERFLVASHDYGGGTVAFILALVLLMLVLRMLSRWGETGSQT